MHNVRAKSLQLCLTLCDPKDCSLPDSSAHGILQARILKWVAVHSSRGAFWGRDRSLCLLPALADRFFTTRATWKASGSSSVSSQTWVYNQLFWGRVWNTNLWLMGVYIRHLGQIYQQKMIPTPPFFPFTELCVILKENLQHAWKQVSTPLDKKTKNNQSQMKWCICCNKLASGDNQVPPFPQTTRQFWHSSQELFYFPDILKFSILWSSHIKIILLQSHLCCNCFKMPKSSEFLYLIKLDYMRNARD